MQVYELIGKKREYLKIYNMHLNEIKAKKYREEKCQDIEFFNLQYRLYSDYLNLKSLDIDDKCIYEFEKFPLLDKGLDSKYNLILGKYIFYKFKCINQDFLEKQQNTFLEEYVSQGLGTYDFHHLNSDRGPYASFVFLNPIRIGQKITSVCVSENVVYLPNEILVSYLLENGLFEEANKRIVNELEYQKVLNCFDFDYSTSFSEQEINDLKEDGLLNTHILDRRIIVNKSIVECMKKR